MKQHGHSHLPKCTRSVLKTPRRVETELKCGGEYVYLGISNGTTRVLNTNPGYTFISDSVSLSVNADGVPLFKSSNTQLWPILCKLENLFPFVAAVYCGNKKPSNLEDFLSDFLSEYQNLKEVGYHYGDKILNVQFYCFVCDAPARQSHWLLQLRALYC